MDGPTKKSKKQREDERESGGSKRAEFESAQAEAAEQMAEQMHEETAGDGKNIAASSTRRRSVTSQSTSIGGNSMPNIVFEDIRERPDTDPFVIAVNNNFPAAGGTIGGVYPPPIGGTSGTATSIAATGDTLPTLTPEAKQAAIAIGILERDGTTDPTAGQSFVNALALAGAEYRGNTKLYDQVFAALVGFAEEQPDPSTGNLRVRANEWATVAQALTQQGVQAGDIHMVELVAAALTSSIGAGDGRAPSSMKIEIPNFEALVFRQIIGANLDGARGIYVVGMLDELKFFGTIEKLVELWQVGQLPIGKGPASDALYKYWRDSATRMTEIERRNLYARTFGLPGGDASVRQPNIEVADLWLHFVSPVSQYARQFQVDQIFARGKLAVSINQEQIKKAAADLAGNLSLHCYGMAFNAAVELIKQLKDGLGILNDPEIKGAFGAKDPWQVIDQVATTELGGARNSVKYRTMATSGDVIIGWLAKKADQLSKTGRFDIIDLDPTHANNDQDLVDACDQWLAVTGTSEGSVEQYSQPTDAVMQPTRPIQIPSVARDLLASVGVKANGAFK
jgi:hypothetical protein